MRLILDTYILLAMALRRLDTISPEAAQRIADEATGLWASVASLWEIAIKTRLGKLDSGMALEDLPHFFEAGGVTILPITAAHALAQVEPMPGTRDPFDRILLAQCSVEDVRLITLDRALRDHPLAARLAPSSRKPTAKNPKTRP